LAKHGIEDLLGPLQTQDVHKLGDLLDLEPDALVLLKADLKLTVVKFSKLKAVIAEAKAEIEGVLQAMESEAEKSYQLQVEDTPDESKDSFGLEKGSENMNPDYDRFLRSLTNCLYWMSWCSAAFDQRAKLPRMRDPRFEGLKLVLLWILKATFNGIAQIYLCESVLCGMVITIALGCQSPYLMAYGLLGSLSSSVAGVFIMGLSAAKPASQGLYGYDGALLGLAVHTFFKEPNVLLVLVPAFFCGMIRCAMGQSCTKLGLPALTAAFNISILLLLVMANTGLTMSLRTTVGGPVEASMLNVVNDSLATDSLATAKESSSPELQMSAAFFFEAVTKGVGQFAFVETVPGCCCVILAIFFCSLTAGFACVAGSIVALLVSFYAMNLDSASLLAVRAGLFSYCSAGVAACVAGGVFFRSEWRAWVLGLAMAALAPYGVVLMRATGYPAMTVPFVLIAWISMLTGSSALVKPQELPVPKAKGKSMHSVSSRPKAKPAKAVSDDAKVSVGDTDDLNEELFPDAAGELIDKKVPVSTLETSSEF